ncbi:MAG TPA: hypothetical protein VFI17_09015, partial [Solirubrobacterales bacterium]|nr:hypothetical protein [Solirubrobacterales bacterium]
MVTLADPGFRGAFDHDTRVTIVGGGIVFTTFGERAPEQIGARHIGLDVIRSRFDIACPIRRGVCSVEGDSVDPILVRDEAAATRDHDIDPASGAARQIGGIGIRIERVIAAGGIHRCIEEAERFAITVFRMDDLSFAAFNGITIEGNGIAIYGRTCETERMRIFDFSFDHAGIRGLKILRGSRRDADHCG